MALRPGVNLDVLRASLGCLLLLVQARAVFTSRLSGSSWAVLLDKDWGFAASLASHIGWLWSCIIGLRYSSSLCCASRMAPKVSLLAQLVAERQVPATAGWFNGACDQRYKWCWKVMAEVFVYTCGEFTSTTELLFAALDVVCTMAIWTRVYILTDARPLPGAAAAQVLLRLSLSLFVHYCSRRANLGWARSLFSASWLNLYTQRRVSTKDPSYNIVRSPTVVYSSVLCCNNPALLSRIAATSGKDLEPVRLERLGACGAGDFVPPRPAASPPACVAAPSFVGGMEAYDLARRLVFSAGASGSSGADGSSYTSAARKVRVSVKIPDRSPEDLAPGWDSDLHINSQRRAVVLFTYIRRGCIQLVLDMVCHPQVAAGSTPGRGRLATAVSQPRGHAGSENACADSRPAQAARLPAQDSLPVTSCQVVDALVTGSVPEEEMGGNCETVPPRMRASASANMTDAGAGTLQHPPGDPVFGPPVARPGARSSTQTQMMHVLCGEALFAGRTVTLQVGETASLVRLQPTEAANSSSDGAGNALAVAGPPLALPPDVHLQQQVVCTKGGWPAFGGAGLCRLPRRRGQLEGVVLLASWLTQSEPTAHSCPGAELQLTVRQQGRFLPVAQVPTVESGQNRTAMRKSLRTALAEGRVSVAVGHQSDKETAAGAPGTVAESASLQQGNTRFGCPGSCLLAFTPSNSDGLAQVELSTGGVHSASAASVLLVSSAAIACELEQLQAVAIGGLDLGAAPRPLMVVDVIRDFGCFLDIVPALGALSGGSAGVGADGVGRANQPLIEWSLAPVDDTGLCAPVPTRVVFLRPCQPAPRTGLQAGEEGGKEGGSSSCASGGSHGSTAALQQEQHQQRNHDDEDGYLQHRARTLATVGCRLGLNLLRYFLSSGMAACATRVLDVLHNQLGVPPLLLAGHECCSERMTLLHHAARSGSFRVIAAVATWLEARGVDPGWAILSPVGVTPLHLLAVVPGSDVAAALIQLRWPAARHVWRCSKVDNATPAQFATLARGGMASQTVPAFCESAMCSKVASIVVGGPWRCAAALQRRCAAALPRNLARGMSDKAAPALSFMQPPLEAAYATWLTRRVVFMDHLFLAIYIAYCVAQAFKEGSAFFIENGAGLILLAMRLGILMLHSPVRSAVHRWLLTLARREHKRPTGPKAEGPGTASTGGGDALVMVWLLATREGSAVLLELLRLLVMLWLTVGMLSVPHTWLRLVQLRLDYIINAVIRPMASQMRVLPSFLASSVALLGESIITVALFRGSGSSIALLFVEAFARGCVTHGFGLGVTVLLQASARSRFLAEFRELRGGLPTTTVNLKAR